MVVSSEIALIHLVNLAASSARHSRTFVQKLVQWSYGIAMRDHFWFLEVSHVAIRGLYFSIVARFVVRDFRHNVA